MSVAERTNEMGRRTSSAMGANTPCLRRSLEERAAQALLTEALPRPGRSLAARALGPGISAKVSAVRRWRRPPPPPTRTAGTGPWTWQDTRGRAQTTKMCVVSVVSGATASEMGLTVDMRTKILEAVEWASIADAGPVPTSALTGMPGLILVLAWTKDPTITI